MQVRIFCALRSAALSVCLLSAAIMSTTVHAQQVVTLYVNGNPGIGLAVQEYPTCAEPPCCEPPNCDPECTGPPCIPLCSSWDYPCRYLQDALALASEIAEPEVTAEIWVASTDAENPYRPTDCSEFHTLLQNSQSLCDTPWGSGSQAYCAYRSFHMQNNVEIYGGFPPDSADETKYGPGGATFADRDWEEHVTVLSGDLDRNSQFILYCEDGRVCINGFEAEDDGQGNLVPTNDPCVKCRPHPEPSDHPSEPEHAVELEGYGEEVSGGVFASRSSRHIVKATGGDTLLGGLGFCSIDLNLYHLAFVVTSISS